jgi:hypothetical protein
MVKKPNTSMALLLSGAFVFLLQSGAFDTQVQRFLWS